MFASGAYKDESKSTEKKQGDSGMKGSSSKHAGIQSDASKADSGAFAYDERVMSSLVEKSAPKNDSKTGCNDKKTSKQKEKKSTATKTTKIKGKVMSLCKCYNIYSFYFTVAISSDISVSLKPRRSQRTTQKRDFLHLSFDPPASGMETCDYPPESDCATGISDLEDTKDQCDDVSTESDADMSASAKSSDSEDQTIRSLQSAPVILRGEGVQVRQAICI